MKLRSYTPSATQGAINAVAAFGRARSHNTERIAPMFCGTYDGAELRPCQDRPSAMQASALPSRRGNHLRWPDGRWTDLHGTPVHQQESHYTAPTLIPAPKPVAVNHRHRDRPSVSCYVSGSAAPHAKLTETLVRHMRQEYRAGKVSISELAILNGLSKSTIKSAISGKTWAHVK